MGLFSGIRGALSRQVLVLAVFFNGKFRDNEDRFFLIPRPNELIKWSAVNTYPVCRVVDKLNEMSFGFLEKDDMSDG